MLIVTLRDSGKIKGLELHENRLHSKSVDRQDLIKTGWRVDVREKFVMEFCNDPKQIRVPAQTNIVLN